MYFVRPRRTRTSSGSVVRIFRGEFVGQLGGTLSAQGLDRRLLVKEFTGNLALALARAELDSLGRLQSNLMAQGDGVKRGEWIQTAASRSLQLRQDNSNVIKLIKALASAPYLGILGMFRSLTVALLLSDTGCACTRTNTLMMLIDSLCIVKPLHGNRGGESGRARGKYGAE